MICCRISRVFLLFEGVGSAFYCWLNGISVGYSQDSCLPAEFDVTSLLQTDANVLAVQASTVMLPYVSAAAYMLLVFAGSSNGHSSLHAAALLTSKSIAVQVMRWSDGSYLEDQVGGACFL